MAGAYLKALCMLCYPQWGELFSIVALCFLFGYSSGLHCKYWRKCVGIDRYFCLQQALSHEDCKQHLCDQCSEVVLTIFVGKCLQFHYSDEFICHNFIRKIFGPIIENEHLWVCIELIFLHIPDLHKHLVRTQVNKYKNALPKNMSPN